MSTETSIRQKRLARVIAARRRNTTANQRGDKTRGSRRGAAADEVLVVDLLQVDELLYYRVVVAARLSLLEEQ
ncbi:hypothetical protein PR003_g12172 [Phytophthora rubi]|uniref:Uncharacterized protein n=1 Tax=Phytophthora rubi TaxID=129364 RepID=A0A6A4F5X6_9STRA|nr:hypothetical protein PR002_g1587 [Phytophthora rubi]KAE9337103.1 hypothetical protein PR003_g12172 [Phytophthora rubi]